MAWKDDANPGAGFEYLYLAEADYLALPEGTVNAKKVDAPGGEVCTTTTTTPIKESAPRGDQKKRSTTLSDVFIGGKK